MKVTGIVLVCLLLSLDHLPAQNRPGLSLRETFDIYVRAVQGSNLEELFSTVTDSEDMFFLTASGKMIDSREGYYQFHVDWFQESGWEMPVELLEVHEGEDYGYTLATFHYRQKTPEGETYVLDSYFTLIFNKENGMWKVVGDICTPIERHFTGIDPEVKYSEDQKYLLDMIKKRRTVRKYLSKPVPREHILKILDAARMAPTAGNQQPWKFLVIQDRKKLDQLKEEALAWYLEQYRSKKKPGRKELASVREAVRSAIENALSAPVYVAVLVDSQAPYPDYIIHDGTLAAGYLMIAARAFGYGTGFFTTYFPDDKMKAFFHVPANYRLICFTPIGIPEEWPETPQKKSLEDLVVFEGFK